MIKLSRSYSFSNCDDTIYSEDLKIEEINENLFYLNILKISSPIIENLQINKKNDKKMNIIDFSLQQPSKEASSITETAFNKKYLSFRDLESPKSNNLIEKKIKKSLENQVTINSYYNFSNLNNDIDSLKSSTLIEEKLSYMKEKTPKKKKNICIRTKKNLENLSKDILSIDKGFQPVNLKQKPKEFYQKDHSRKYLNKTLKNTTEMSNINYHNNNNNNYNENEENENEINDFLKNFKSKQKLKKNLQLF